MKNSIQILSFLTAVIFGCANASEDDLTESQQPNLITYANDVKPIMDNNCVSCHGTTPDPGANISLVTYNDVKSAVQNNNLISKINGNGPGGLMPQGGPKLPQNLIDLIEKWESDGFLEN